MRPTTLWRLARLEGDVIVFRLYDEIASRVEVFGSWSDWSIGTPAHKLSTRLWEARVPRTDAPQVAYKLLLDGTRWLDDPANPRKAPDGHGGVNAVLVFSDAVASGAAATISS